MFPFGPVARAAEKQESEKKGEAMKYRWFSYENDRGQTVPVGSDPQVEPPSNGALGFFAIIVACFAGVPWQFFATPLRWFRRGSHKRVIARIYFASRLADLLERIRGLFRPGKSR